ncbi:hypothetical protein JXM83_04370 [Candidatus Woesearchaeota archaeon]|nr:hypothetical protein [Candidatus Woesearchaeota archaeon]
MPLHELVSEEEMQKYRRASQEWREIARDLIRHYNYKHLKPNKSSSPDKFRIDFVLRRNYHRSSLDEDQNYTEIMVKQNGQEVPKVIFDSLHVSRYTILFNVRGTFLNDTFNLGYGKDDMRGPIKVHTGSGLYEISDGTSLDTHINKLVEEHRHIIGEAPGYFILQALNLCNNYIDTLKTKKGLLN